MKAIIKLPVLTLGMILLSYLIFAAILAGIESFGNLSLSLFSMLTLVLSYTTMVLAGLIFSIYLKPPYALQIGLVMIVYLAIALIVGGFHALPYTAMRMAVFGLVTILFQWWKKRMKES